MWGLASSAAHCCSSCGADGQGQGCSVSGAMEGLWDMWCAREDGPRAGTVTVPGPALATRLLSTFPPLPVPGGDAGEKGWGWGAVFPASTCPLTWFCPSTEAPGPSPQLAKEPFQRGAVAPALSLPPPAPRHLFLKRGWRLLAQGPLLQPSVTQPCPVHPRGPCRSSVPFSHLTCGKAESERM